MKTEIKHDIKFIQYGNFINFIHLPTYGCAELTLVNTHLLNITIHDLYNESYNNKKHCKIINNIKDDDQQWLFFNRLYRRDYINKKGLNVGRKLLTPLCKFADKHKLNIFCQVNPYYSMDKYRLIKLYKEFNFVNIFDCKQYDNGLIRYYVTANFIKV